MKRITILFIGNIIIMMMMLQCKGPQIIHVPVHDSTAIETSETITENPTWTDPESILYQFAFECDSAYNVILKKYNELNTGIRGSVEIKEIIVYREDKQAKNRLLVDISVLIDSLEIQNRTIERLRKEKRMEQVPINVEIPVKYTPKWKNYCTCGFFITILFVILYLYFRIKMKIIK